MITVRLTRKRNNPWDVSWLDDLEGIAQEHPLSIYAELIYGGIDVKKPYSSTMEKKTGDLIYTQDEPKKGK